MADFQVEIRKRPYGHNPYVEVAAWRSAEENYNFVFEVVDLETNELDIAGKLVGRIPPEIIQVLEKEGYNMRRFR